MPSRPKKTTTVHKFKDAVYGRTIAVVIASEAELVEFYNELPHEDFIESIDWAGLFLHLEFEEGGQSFIFLNRDCKKDLNCILIHEVAHLALDVFRSVGITLSIDSEEAFAYYLEYLYSNLSGLVNASNKRKTKTPVRNR